MMKAGFPIDEPLNTIGETFLHVFCRRAEPELDKIQRIVELGGSLAVCESTGKTPLHYLVQTDKLGGAI